MVGGSVSFKPGNLVQETLVDKQRGTLRVEAPASRRDLGCVPGIILPVIGPRPPDSCPPTPCLRRRSEPLCYGSATYVKSWKSRPPFSQIKHSANTRSPVSGNLLQQSRSCIDHHELRLNRLSLSYPLQHAVKSSKSTPLPYELSVSMHIAYLLSSQSHSTQPTTPPLVSHTNYGNGIL
jgi:hypothetical protein